MNRSILSVGGVAAALTVALIGSASAVETVDLEGAWRFRFFETPSRLQETYYDAEAGEIRTSEDSRDAAGPGETLNDVSFPGPFSSESGVIQIGPDGVVTGDVSGSITTDTRSGVTLTSGGEEHALDVTEDLGRMAGAGEFGGENVRLLVFHRVPSGMATADLAGDWTLHRLVTPARLRETYLNVGTGSTRTTVDADGGPGPGEALVDMFFPDPFETTRESFAISADGEISGDFAGTASAAGDGTVTVQTGGVGITLLAEGSGSVMTMLEGDDDQQEFGIALREPAAANLPELAGTWEIVSLRTPSRLRKRYVNESGDVFVTEDSRGTAPAGYGLVDVWFPSEFGAPGNRTVTIDAAGELRGAEIGTVSLTDPGEVSVNIGDDSFTFTLDASKRLMVGAFGREDERELVMVVKTSPDQAFGDLPLSTPLIRHSAGTLKVMWNGEAGRVLQRASDLMGDWESVTTSANRSAFTETLDDDGFFYRVIEE